MSGLNDSYVESVIRKAIAGRLSTGQAAAYDGRLWYVAEVEKRAGEKKAERPKWVPGPSHLWKRFVINPKKG
ncbi:MAG: hypothetical protein K6E59_06590 [Bacilli bacterium]|nr:hypothetical protein [Bacilli bacterium]